MALPRLKAVRASSRPSSPALRGGGRGPSRDDLAAAYATLGVPADASDSAVRQAYRRLMSENHPDKLAAKGLPESTAQRRLQALHVGF